MTFSITYSEENIEAKIFHLLYGDIAGPRAVLDCEPRQVRKEAAVAIDAGAAMWLALVTTSSQVYINDLFGISSQISSLYFSTNGWPRACSARSYQYT